MAQWGPGHFFGGRHRWGPDTYDALNFNTNIDTYDVHRNINISNNSTNNISDVKGDGCTNGNGGADRQKHGDGTIGMGTEVPNFDPNISEVTVIDPDISEVMKFDPNISEVLKVDPNISEVMRFDPRIPGSPPLG